MSGYICNSWGPLYPSAPLCPFHHGTLGQPFQKFFYTFLISPPLCGMTRNHAGSGHAGLDNTISPPVCASGYKKKRTKKIWSKHDTFFRSARFDKKAAGERNLGDQFSTPPVPFSAFWGKNLLNLSWGVPDTPRSRFGLPLAGGGPHPFGPEGGVGDTPSSNSYTLLMLNLGVAGQGGGTQFAVPKGLDPKGGGCTACLVLRKHQKGGEKWNLLGSCSPPGLGLQNGEETRAISHQNALPLFYQKSATHIFCSQSLRRFDTSDKDLRPPGRPQEKAQKPTRVQLRVKM